MNDYFYTLEERSFIYQNIDKMQLKEIAEKIGRSYKGLSNFVVQAGWSNKRSYTKAEEMLVIQGKSIYGRSENALKIKRCRLLKNI